MNPNSSAILFLCDDDVVNDTAGDIGFIECDLFLGLSPEELATSTYRCVDFVFVSVKHDLSIYDTFFFEFV